MGMSMHVVGIKAPDDKWQRMKAVLDCCRQNQIRLPKEVEDFFDGQEKDDNGVVVEIDEKDCCQKYSEDMRSGFIIDVKKLPKDITHVKFFCSW